MKVVVADGRGKAQVNRPMYIGALSAGDDGVGRTARQTMNHWQMQPEFRALGQTASDCSRHAFQQVTTIYSRPYVVRTPRRPDTDKSEKKSEGMVCLCNNVLGAPSASPTVANKQRKVVRMMMTTTKCHC